MKGVFTSICGLIVSASFMVSAQKPVTLWKAGDEGSLFYRIPAITRCNDGTLIAAADKRIESMRDLPGKIEVVVKRSTDNGLTWGATQTIAPYDSTGGSGDPLLITHKPTGRVVSVFTHGAGFWQSEPAEIRMAYTDDNGVTWSIPKSISESFFSTDSLSDAPVIADSQFASSGRGVCLKSGRMLFLLVTRKKGKKQFVNYAIYSDDGGASWTSSGNPVCANGDEAKLVELADGRLLASIRTRSLGPRHFAISEDEGITWKALPDAPTLLDPACNGALLRLEGTERLLHTLPASGEARRRVALFESNDVGRTWKEIRVVVPGSAAYSEIVELPDGIGILTEEVASKKGAYDIVFRKL